VCVYEKERVKRGEMALIKLFFYRKELHKKMMRNKLHFLILGLAVYVLVHTELKR